MSQMPLFEMSANVRDATPRKRSHDAFAGEDNVKVEGEEMECLTPSKAAGNTLLTAWTSTPKESTMTTATTNSNETQETPSKKLSSKATEDNSARENPDSKPANGQIQANGNAPAPKRKKLTPAEKEARDKEIAEKKEAKEREAEQKKQEREEKAKIKAEEKAKADQEKAERAAEKEEKRKKKEEEEKQKAHEKEEKERLKKEAEEKKKRAQPSVASFFGSKALKKVDSPKTPTPAEASPSATTKDADKITDDEYAEYRKRFKPFFVKQDTRVANASAMMDDEARILKSKILDEYLSGQRAYEADAAFDMIKTFELPYKPRRRGFAQTAVRSIMQTMQKDMACCSATGSEADQVLRQMKEKLSRIPMNVIAFSRDVRPPYYGTSTYKPSLLEPQRLSTLARRPHGRILQLEYDYDSEAEWQEEEEGEDLDADDDEEEMDDEDDMDGFLDDSEDAGMARRVFVNTIEPESTGVCFEGGQHFCDYDILHQHKMEYIHESIPSNESIDPWSTSYWQPEPKKASSKPIAAIKKESSPSPMAPPPPPANAFAAIGKNSSLTSTPSVSAVKFVKDEILDDFKQAILDNKALSKVGIIDFVYQQFRDQATKTEVKNTIELVAEKVKGAGSRKEWGLKAGHELKT